MTKQGLKVEQVLAFLNDKNCGSILAEYVDKKLKSLDLPKDMSVYDNLDDDDRDELEDDVMNYGICFFCDFGEENEKDNVYVMGYNPDTREMLVKGGMVLDGLCPVSIDELEFSSLLELAIRVFDSADIEFAKVFKQDVRH